MSSEHKSDEEVVEKVGLRDSYGLEEVETAQLVALHALEAKARLQFENIQLKMQMLQLEARDVQELLRKELPGRDDDIRQEIAKRLGVPFEELRAYVTDLKQGRLVRQPAQPSQFPSLQPKG